MQLDVPGSTRPMGYCDGSAEDEAELRRIAESEGYSVQSRGLRR